MGVECTMYERKVHVDMLNAVKSMLADVSSVTPFALMKLFTPFVPMCSQFRLYICYLREFVKNKTHRFQCFNTNYIVIKRVYT